MTPNNLVHENERLDELHRNGYYIIQDPARFCFGMDAVLLSGFARARRGERVLDLGTGTGIIPILMEAKTEAEDFTALEIQEESADMARRSVLYNHLEEKIRVVTGLSLIHIWCARGGTVPEEKSVDAGFCLCDRSPRDEAGGDRSGAGTVS